MAKKKIDQPTIQELQTQLKQMEEQWKRALADYANLQKRVAAQQQQFVKLSTASFIMKLLPVVDHLERAATQLKDQGIGMIVKQLQELLQSEAVKPIEALGKPYDHATMEGIDQVPGEKDRVIEVAETGYLIGDHVLRPAKVKVGNGQAQK